MSDKAKKKEITAAHAKHMRLIPAKAVVYRTKKRSGGVEGRKENNLPFGFAVEIVKPPYL
jgi:hypothetical protein